MRFRNREEAALHLADRLAGYRGLKPIVLGIPESAISMARIIADSLGGDLDWELVGRTRAPGQSESSMRCERIRDQRDILRMRRDGIASVEQVDEERRIAIIVDDRVVTGASMLAAIEAARALRPRRTVVAVGVAPGELLTRMRAEVDEVVCLHVTEDLPALDHVFDESLDLNEPGPPTSCTDTRLSFAQVLAQELDAIEGRTIAQPPQSLAESTVYRRIHNRVGRSDEGRPLAALCLSGGGIRSATFGLGVIQGLAKCRLLPQFHYLSTVSGGGYLGSWLTAWIHRTAGDVRVRDPLARVTQELAGEGLAPIKSPTDNAMGAFGLAAEATAIARLRRFSNYLAPEVGVLSADIWTIAATVLRNVFLNWMVLIPALLTGLGTPRLMAWATSRVATKDTPEAHTLNAWALSLVLVGFVGCAWTIAYVNRTRTLTLDKRPSQPRVIVLAIAPMWIAGMSLGIAAALRQNQGQPFDVWAMIGFACLAMTFGWLGYRGLVAAAHADVDQDLVLKGRRLVWEILVFEVAGLVGGSLLWFAAYLFTDIKLWQHTLWALAYPAVAPAAFVLSFTLAATILVGLASSQMSEEDREWWSRFGAWALIAATGWTAVGTAVLLLPEWIASAPNALAHTWPYVGTRDFARSVFLGLVGATTIGTGVLTILGGFSEKTIYKSRARNVSTSRGETEKDTNAQDEEKSWLPAAVQIALPIFVVLFVVFLSVLTDLLVDLSSKLGSFTFSAFWRDYVDSGYHIELSQRSSAAAVLSIAFVLAVVASCRIDINKFSLHAMYRNRLIRAFLGASRGNERHEDRFIGFDPQDDVALCSIKPQRGLFHVVNMALNLVGGEELAWQERKADSMTASPLHIGTRDLGYRRAHEYGGPGGKTMTLGTAMAISGAAASPNMGYHSSPVLTFLMTMFNARLGWWLGNPGPAGEQTYRRESPRFALLPLAAEAFGRTDRRHPYVYASDGGHFDNLGLYEMVRRRCHFILVVDGGADADCAFEDLSAAIRKIRSDMRIPIDVPSASERCIFARSDQADRNMRGKMAFLGRIHYSEIDGEQAPDGLLVYIKPAFYDSAEPLDVVEYARAHRSFPHETTGDQFFSESQFESYRALGLHAMERMTRGFQARSLEDLNECIAEYVQNVRVKAA